ncbi:MAG TPA: biotin/lipoyl-binding protein [Paucimonas sp.]|nr:biotin/lipoyl-binding protein [Paucimonas sp.]
MTLILALGIYAYVGEYTCKVRIVGQLVPSAGVLNVVAPQSGRILARHVRDGDAVHAGQLLYELSSERTGSGDGIDTRIDASLAARRDLLMQERTLQARQLQQHEKSLRTRQQLLSAEIARPEQEIALQQNRIANSDRMLARYRTLREQGFVSEYQLGLQDNERMLITSNFKIACRDKI